MGFRVKLAAILVCLLGVVLIFGDQGFGWGDEDYYYSPRWYEDYALSPPRFTRLKCPEGQTATECLRRYFQKRYELYRDVAQTLGRPSWLPQMVDELFHPSHWPLPRPGETVVDFMVNNGFGPDWDFFYRARRFNRAYEPGGIYKIARCEDVAQITGHEIIDGKRVLARFEHVGRTGRRLIVCFIKGIHQDEVYGYYRWWPGIWTAWTIKEPGEEVSEWRLERGAVLPAAQSLLAKYRRLKQQQRQQQQQNEGKEDQRHEKEKHH